MATTDLERLVVQLSADYKKFENSMNRANGVMARQMRQMERTTSASVKRINASLGGIGGNTGTLAKGLLAGFTLQGAQQIIDAGTKITNSLKVAGLEGDNLKKTYEALFQSAQKNGAEIGTLATVYGRVAIVQNQLGISNEQLLKFTDNLAASLKAQGISAAEAAGPMLQLSQALGTGIVRAEEYNSIQEGMPVILRAVAAGLKEAGGDVATLTNLVKNGEVSSKAFFAAFEAGSPIIQDLASKTTPTLSNEFTKLYNVLVDTAVKFNENSNVVEQMKPVFSDLASLIRDIGNAFNEAIGWANSFGEALNKINSVAVNFGTWLGEKTGLREVGRLIENAGNEAVDFSQKTAAAENVAKRINEAFGPLTTAKGDRVTAKPAEPIKPVSLADYAVPAKASKAKTGGAKTHQKTADQQIDSDIQSIRDRIATMQLETQLVGKSYQEQEKRRMSLELEQQALAKLRDEAIKKGQTDLSNIKLSDEQRSKIDQVSDAYARQADELRRVQEQQDRADQAASEFYDTFKSSMSGAIRGAESFSDALSNILDKLADMLLNAAFDALFKPSTGGTGGGLFGSLFSGLGSLIPGFAKGTNSAPRGLAVVGENGPELVRFGGGEQVIPNNKLRAPTMPNLRSGTSSSSGSFTFAPQIDARGADSAAVARLEQVVARQQAEFEGRVVGTMRNAKKTRNWRGG
jgi:tape measure domain-containing protein